MTDGEKPRLTAVPDTGSEYDPNADFESPELYEAGTEETVLEELELDPATEYIRQRTQEVGRLYGELGLDPQFLAIFDRHLNDLRIARTNTIDESRLWLVRRGPDDPVNPLGWKRRAEISKTQLEEYRRIIIDSIDAIKKAGVHGEIHDNDTITRSLAFDWVFYELTADAAANSCYMQQKYNRYVSDYNCQSPHYRAELTISGAYLHRYDDHVPVQAVERDHRDFRSGMSLILLHDAVLHSGLFTSAAQTRLFIMQLRKSYLGRKDPDGVTLFDPLHQGEIAMRLGTIEPTDHIKERARLAEYLLSLEDEDADEVLGSDAE